MSSHVPESARVIPLRPVNGAPVQVSQVPGRAPAAAREPLWRHVVGDVLRRERLAQRRTLKDVAEAARISMPYLSELERGRKEASSEVLAAAAQALGLGLADLLALTYGELLRLASGKRNGPVGVRTVRTTGVRRPGVGRADGASEARGTGPAPLADSEDGPAEDHRDAAERQAEEPAYGEGGEPAHGEDREPAYGEGEEPAYSEGTDAPVATETGAPEADGGAVASYRQVARAYTELSARRGAGRRGAGDSGHAGPRATVRYGEVRLAA